jgi:hypothetical protein
LGERGENKIKTRVFPTSTSRLGRETDRVRVRSLIRAPPVLAAFFFFSEDAFAAALAGAFAAALAGEGAAALAAPDPPAPGESADSSLGHVRLLCPVSPQLPQVTGFRPFAAGVTGALRAPLEACSMLETAVGSPKATPVLPAATASGIEASPWIG